MNSLLRLKSTVRPLRCKLGLFWIGSQLTLLSSLGFAQEAGQPDGSLKWIIKPLCIDANEGIDIGDVDGDQKPDVVAGRNWYASPDFVARPLRSIADWNGYVESNGDYLVDVNRDGKLDVIAGSFIPTKVFWYENPGAEGYRLGQQWKEHLLVDTTFSQNEGQLLEDIDGDKRPEWIVNSWAADVPMVVWRMEETESKDDKGVVTKSLKAVSHRLGEKGNGHGLGVGDISGDGKADVLVGTGWYEQPTEGAWEKPWIYHKDWNLQASVPMLVIDVDKDGKNDIVWGNGHDYGVFWWRNTGNKENGVIQWDKKTIDDTFSQPHALAWADLDKDGQPELITGKRYYAHNGGDPGGKDMPLLVYYKWDAKSGKFSRHDIQRGEVGCGLQVRVADIDLNGWADIAVAGKSGTYVILNQGYGKSTAAK
jgi:hypothetical protein